MKYEVGLGHTVRAFHVMPGMPGPEGQRHDHDYRIEVVVGRRELSDRAMVCDLDMLEAELTGLAARVGDKDLEDAIRPPDGQGVTVEMFARWAHEMLADPVRRAGGETLAVRIWESATAFGGYRGAVCG